MPVCIGNIFDKDFFKVWRSKHGLELVGPGYFGYEAEYKPIEEINNRSN